MQFVDCALARRLEASEDEAQRAIAAVLRSRRPDLLPAALDIAGGHAVFAGKGSPVGRVIGAGLAGPVTQADIDQVEAFYHAHGVPAQFDITPLTDDSLPTILRQRGYVMTELNNVMARRLDPAERFADQLAGVEFRACTPEEAMLWARTMLRGFFSDSEPPAGWDEFVFPMAVAPGSLATIAWLDGQPAACSAGLLCREWKLLMLGGTSTLPQYRGRGLQTAAIARRLNQAVEHGCDLVVVVTRGGTTSQRNVERFGFTVAYSKATLAEAEAK